MPATKRRQLLVNKIVESAGALIGRKAADEIKLHSAGFSVSNIAGNFDI